MTEAIKNVFAAKKLEVLSTVDAAVYEAEHDRLTGSTSFRNLRHSRFPDGQRYGPNLAWYARGRCRYYRARYAL